jgi:hypothetical protein
MKLKESDYFEDLDQRFWSLFGLSTPDFIFSETTYLQLSTSNFLYYKPYNTRKDFIFILFIPFR